MIFDNIKNSSGAIVKFNEDIRAQESQQILSVEINVILCVSGQIILGVLRILEFSSSRSSNLRLHDPENKGTRMLQGFHNYLPINTALYHKRLVTSAHECPNFRSFLVSGFCFGRKNCAEASNCKL
jgi:hypothetical protein